MFNVHDKVAIDTIFGRQFNSWLIHSSHILFSELHTYFSENAFLKITWNYFANKTLFAVAGCNSYGMGVGFFGLNSIVTLSAIACERYIVITSSSCRPAATNWRITHHQARKVEIYRLYSIHK